MSDEQEEVSEQAGPFPGLNKAHGFFRVIEKNQRARDSYHQEKEGLKEARRLEAEQDWRNYRQHASRRSRPTQALYRPPHKRPFPKGVSVCDAKGVYRLEVELANGKWITCTIKFGCANEQADELASKHSLDPYKKFALIEMMEDFEQSITRK